MQDLKNKFIDEFLNCSPRSLEKIVEQAPERLDNLVALYRFDVDNQAGGVLVKGDEDLHLIVSCEELLHARLMATGSSCADPGEGAGQNRLVKLRASTQLTVQAVGVTVAHLSRQVDWRVHLSSTETSVAFAQATHINANPLKPFVQG